MSRSLKLIAGALLAFGLAGLLSCVYIKEMNLIRLSDKQLTPTTRAVASQPSTYPQTVDEVMENIYGP